MIEWCYRNHFYFYKENIWRECIIDVSYGVDGVGGGDAEENTEQIATFSGLPYVNQIK